jgi:hypothetical protein
MPSFDEWNPHFTTDVFSSTSLERWVIRRQILEETCGEESRQSARINDYTVPDCEQAEDCPVFTLEEVLEMTKEGMFLSLVTQVFRIANR